MNAYEKRPVFTPNIDPIGAYCQILRAHMPEAYASKHVSPHFDFIMDRVLFELVQTPVEQLKSTYSLGHSLDELSVTQSNLVKGILPAQGRDLLKLAVEMSAALVKKNHSWVMVSDVQLPAKQKLQTVGVSDLVASVTACFGENDSRYLIEQRGGGDKLRQQRLLTQRLLEFKEFYDIIGWLGYENFIDGLGTETQKHIDSKVRIVYVGNIVEKLADIYDGYYNRNRVRTAYVAAEAFVLNASAGLHLSLQELFMTTDTWNIYCNHLRQAAELISPAPKPKKIKVEKPPHIKKRRRESKVIHTDFYSSFATNIRFNKHIPLGYVTVGEHKLKLKKLSAQEMLDMLSEMIKIVDSNTNVLDLLKSPDTSKVFFQLFFSQSDILQSYVGKIGRRKLVEDCVGCGIFHISRIDDLEQDLASLFLVLDQNNVLGW